jgi:hypothetical protein
MARGYGRKKICSARGRETGFSGDGSAELTSKRSVAGRKPGFLAYGAATRIAVRLSTTSPRLFLRMSWPLLRLKDAVACSALSRARSWATISAAHASFPTVGDPMLSWEPLC